MRSIIYRIFGEKYKEQLAGYQFTLTYKLVYLSFIATITLSGFLFSCSNDNAAPDGVLSKAEMTKILTDFYLKEARLNALRVAPDSTQKLMLYFRSQYAEQSGIPDSLVELSYQYYVEHPKDLAEIYDRIIDSLSLMEQLTRGDVP